MASKLILVLLVACTASAVLGEKPAEELLQRRAGGLLSQLLDFSGSLTQSAVNKLVSGGHTTLNAIDGIINYGADAFKSGMGMLLRRDLGYNAISSMINTAQANLDASWKAANQLARNLRPSLSEKGKEVLDMYMNELKISRAHYKNALQDAAASANDLNNRLASSPISNQEEVWSLLQDKYAVEMVDYAKQIRRLGNVLNNNGLDS